MRPKLWLPTFLDNPTKLTEKGWQAYVRPKLGISEYFVDVHLGWGFKVWELCLNHIVQRHKNMYPALTLNYYVNGSNYITEPA